MENYLFKILLGGCVGHKRTEIMNRFTTGQSNSGTRVKIGVDFAVHCVDLPEHGGTVNHQIWDFGEEQRFRTLIPCFCQGASGAMLYFDLVRSDSLYELEDWISLIRKHTKDIPIILCGANCIETKAIGDDKIEEFIIKHRLNGYFDISVVNGCNIDESFDKLTELMVELWPSFASQSETGATTLIHSQFH